MEHLADRARINPSGVEALCQIDRNADRGAGACKLNGIHDEPVDGNDAPDGGATFCKRQQLRR